MFEPKEFMSLEEVAELLGVNYQLIYKQVRSGELVSVRIGRVYRVTKADFEAYIEKSRKQSQGGTCSTCGTFYASRLSLKNLCLECDEPICMDCWSRLKIRVCPTHKKDGADPSQTPPAHTGA